MKPCDKKHAKKGEAVFYRRSFNGAFWYRWYSTDCI